MNNDWMAFGTGYIVEYPITPKLKKWFKDIGKKGGKARAKKLSPARRQEIARLGGKAKKKP